MEKIKKLLYIDKPEEFYAADIVDIQRKYLEEFETILYVDREINKTIILSQAFDLRYFIKKIFGFDYETSEHYHVGKIKGLDYFYWKIPVNILEFLRKYVILSNYSILNEWFDSLSPLSFSTN